MNILIPHSWLLEYLKTDAKPDKIANCLSLCGASVEKIIKKKKDSIYDIEITSNRVDMAGIWGIAREASVILPQFNVKASFIKNPYNITKNLSKFKVANKVHYLNVVIKNKNLCPRFTAVLLNNVKIKQSSGKIKSMLQKVNLRAINNVIDISNYLMHEFGQPVHVFDFDKIKGKKMILRESRSNDKITTLDGKQHILPGKDIIIEDGEGRIIDLCGIMGGLNSCVDENTKRVLLFVQNYNPVSIRRTTMLLSHRSEAASLFEKQIDPELVMPTLLKGITLIKRQAGATEDNHIIDIYPKPYQAKVINLDLNLVTKYLDLNIPLQKTKSILELLGFKAMKNLKKNISFKIPSWRSSDVSIPEDLIEEIARIYGYHNLPSKLPTGSLPEKNNLENFNIEKQIKHTLKDWGFTEIYSYSMQSKKELRNCYLDPKDHLKITNPLTKEWVYMRTTIIPSLLTVISTNAGKYNKFKIFELANIYLKKTASLPNERLTLTLVVTGKKSFLKLKGIIEVLLKQTGTTKLIFKPYKNNQLFNLNKSAYIISKSHTIGLLGSINRQVLEQFSIKKEVCVAELDFEQLINSIDKIISYNQISKFPAVIEDLTFKLLSQVYYHDMVETIKSLSTLIHKIELVDVYKNFQTLRITYHSKNKNLSSKDTLKARTRIIDTIEKKGWGKLKDKY